MISQQAMYPPFLSISLTHLQKAIKDWHLLLLVLGLCLIDIVYISISLAIDRDYGPKKVPDKEKKSTTNVRY